MRWQGSIARQQTYTTKWGISSQAAISAGAGICWNCYKRWDDKQPTEWEKAYIDACRAEDLDKIYALLKNAEKKGW